MNIEIGAPVYNEESGITVFLTALETEISEITRNDPGIKFSLLLVNDGSSDKTLEIIKKFPYHCFVNVRIISFSRNFGHSAAISALIDNSEADALLLMDADMQDTPKVLAELVRKWKEGFQSVQVVRTKRSESLVFRFGHFIYSKIFTLLSGLRSDVGIFGIYDSDVIQSVRSYPERLRFIPGIISSAGFKKDYVSAPRDKRLDGNSKVGFSGLIRLGLLAWFSYSSIPIHLITGVGVLISFLSFFAGIVVIIIKLATDMAIPGWASLLSAQFFLGGLIILSLGVLGQYIGIIFQEVKQRPVYLVADVIHMTGEDSGTQK